MAANMCACDYRFMKPIAIDLCAEIIALCHLSSMHFSLLHSMVINRVTVKAAQSLTSARSTKVGSASVSSSTTSMWLLRAAACSAVSKQLVQPSSMPSTWAAAECISNAHHPRWESAMGRRLGTQFMKSGSLDTAARGGLITTIFQFLTIFFNQSSISFHRWRSWAP